jgi:hypothetical protein
MKGKTGLIIPLLLLAWVQLRADAGFSISRRKPACRITFEGTASIGKAYTLVRVDYGYHDSDWRRDHRIITGRDTVDDQFSTVIQNGGRRWDESERYVHFALLDTAGHISDSFMLYMKKFNYHLVVTGVKDGKLQHTIKKRKAVFEYGLVSYDEPESSRGTTRWIFICCSLAGLLALVVLFIKKRKNQTA